MQLMNSGFGVGSNGGNAPWITDIHNGIYNPLFTYTGGQAIVPDEDGILRRTPAGYPAVEGGRWAATVAEGALLGPEVVTNEADRTFSSDTGWWIGSRRTIAAGVCTYSGTDGTASLVRSLVISVGRKYQVSGELTRHVSGTLKFDDNGAGVTLKSSVGSFNVIVTSGTTGITLYSTIGCDFDLDNVSIKEVIPQWYAPTLGATSSISTRKGLRTIQTSDAFKGMLVEPAMTNKCTCRKSNPTDTTGVTGAGGATVTRVRDTDALIAGGYQDICTTFYDYELSIPQNGTISMAGAVANLNKHSLSLDMRLVSGIGVQLGLTGQTSDVTLTAAFSRQKKENLTPLAITDVITITNLNADTAVVRCILPQLEESPFCTSPIAPAADTAAAQTLAASVVSASTSGVFPSTGQDFAIFMRVVPEASGQENRFLFSIYHNNTNYSALYYASSAQIFTQNNAGATTWTSVAYPQVAGQPFDVIVARTSSGIAIKKRHYTTGAWSSWSAWTQNITVGGKLPSPIAATYRVGSHNSSGQLAANYPRTAIIAMPPKATLAEYQAWIEQELTLRGLI